jgi:hypothetical protein
LFFGHVGDNPPWLTYILPGNGEEKLAYVTGGSGVLMSKAAYLRFAALLFTPECEVVLRSTPSRWECALLLAL